MNNTSIFFCGLAVSATVFAVACSSSSDTSSPEDADGGGVIPAYRFVTSVVSFTPGDCAGFGQTKMPGIVEGPPVGAGALAGSLDVVSLGNDGEIVLGFAPNAIVDGPGVDFIVFENPFWINGNPDYPAAELGEVSVSEDGVTWKVFPCTPTPSPPYGECAGWHPVFSAPGNGISPIDPNVAGGDPFDLADVGLATARYVRIRDVGTTECPANPPKPNTGGFDLDAISIVNSQLP
ncbi:MAG: cell surface protein [Polyangiaceae bacterium]|nr:cell surface protein [Polyangiaceae bacterium]